MKKQKQIFYLAMVITLAAIISSCNQDAAPSLYQVEPKGGTPVISTILPANDALAGVTEITITGSNFSRLKEENLVFFGTAQATVLQASSTQLVVKAPTLIKNSLDLKISVQGVENFSNVVKYNLLEAVGVYFAFAKGIDDPYTVAVDNVENVYVYLKDKGIKKISSTGTLNDFAPKGGESFFFDMKVGPKEGNDNVIYGARKVNALFKVVEGKSTSTYVIFPSGKAVETLDFDVNKNIWAAGSGGNIYSVTPLKVFTPFPIDYTVSALRVYNDYLYVAGKNSTEEAIFRYKINSNLSLGSKEKYFDIGAKYGLNKVLVGAMTFSENGDLIVGTDLIDAFLIVNSSGTVSSLYPGLISPIVKSLAWGTKKNLFYIREYTDAGTILHSLVRVDMQKLSAPYYGRQ
ncbi:MAG: IPT/TIG domain-containing protein [Melioribacteraceae bacterium]